MTLVKNFIRYWLASLLEAMGLTELCRSVFIQWAQRYVKQLTFIKGAWIRRSLINQDFIPLLSDIDLTILIDDSEFEKHFEQMTMKTSWPIQDIQVISTDFQNDWELTGGLRNYQIPQWKSLKSFSPKLKTPIPLPSLRSQIAFELGHEVYLLYRQLNEKMGLPGKLHEISRQKLMQELKRLLEFWHSLEPELLLKPRKEFLLTPDFWPSQIQFWKDLLLAIPPALQTYSPDSNSGLLSLKVNGKQVMLVSEISHLTTSEYFFATVELLCLIKGVGVQEQELLNSLTLDKKSYFYRFNRQRLAHDLINGLLFARTNDTQIYYCFKNIKDFLVAHNKTPPLWIFPLEWNEAKALNVPEITLMQQGRLYLEELKSLG